MVQQRQIGRWWRCCGVHRQPWQVAAGVGRCARIAGLVQHAGVNARALGAVVIATERLGGYQVHIATTDVERGQYFLANQAGIAECECFAQLQRVTHQGIAGQGDAQCGLGSANDAVGGVGAIVLARCQCHAHGAQYRAVHHHRQGQAGRADVAGDIGLQQSDLVLTLGECAGQRQFEVAKTVDGGTAAEGLAWIGHAVEVQVIEGGDFGAHLALALNHQAVSGFGAPVVFDPCVAGGGEGEIARRIHGAVHAQGQCGRHGAAVACLVHCDRGDGVAARAEGKGCGWQSEDVFGV